MNYRLLALDVDGTIADPRSRVAPEVCRAIRKVQAASMRVCLATGRTLWETQGVWRQLALSPPYDPLVLSGGALVSEPHSGRTLYHKPIDQGTTRAFARLAGDLGLTAMALVDRWRWGVEYYVVPGRDAAEVDEHFLGKMDVDVRRVDDLEAVADLPAALRLNALTHPDRADGLVERFSEQFDGRLNVHAILAPNYGAWILEGFHPQANKWTALRYVAQGLRLPARSIVAVGDDINDLPMLRGAGLGAAMPSAPQSVRDAADVVVEGSVAEFVEQLLAGEFDELAGCDGSDADRERTQPEA